MRGAGIRRAAEPDSEIAAMPAIGSIFRSYNALLDRFSGHDDLEALVLVHQDAEIVDAGFCATIREALHDPEVGLVGCVGSGRCAQHRLVGGVGHLCVFCQPLRGARRGRGLHCSRWSWSEAPAYARLGEVETLDGFVLVLSPWVVKNIRFDESLGQFHGYDLDCASRYEPPGARS